MEAVEFAGHQKLDNLILIYDSNDVTLDAMADKTQSENTALRFKAIEWDVQTIDGNDMAGVPEGLQQGEEGEERQAAAHHRPHAHRQGHPRSAGHARRPTARAARSSRTRRARASACRPTSTSTSATRCGPTSRSTRSGSSAPTTAGTRRYKAWREANPEKAALLDSAPANAERGRPPRRRSRSSPRTRSSRTRKAGRDVLQPLAAELPLLIGGSADLYGSTLNYIAADKDFDPTNRAGRNIRFGIREHGMAAMLNGVAYDGLFRPRSPRSSSSPTTRGRRSASPRSRSCRSSTSSRTTPSASARTARPTSRSRRSPRCA